MAYMLTSCNVHGTKETAEYDSARIYAHIIRDCWQAMQDAPLEHLIEHASDDVECWVCCPDMLAFHYSPLTEEELAELFD